MSHVAGKWYYKTWVIVLSFIVFFPLGFFLIWRNPAWSQRKKKISSVFASVVLITFIALSIIFAPPSIDVTSALSPVKGGDYTLTGKTDTPGATVTVNGKTVSLHGDQFSVDLDLKEGDNTFTIVVTDGDKRTEKTVTIHRYTKEEIKQKFPVYTHKTMTEARAVHYGTKAVQSSAYAKGTRQITTRGVNGKDRLTFRITYKNGKQVSKELIKTETILQPVTQVTTIGTYVAPPKPPSDGGGLGGGGTTSNCDSHYYGCVPIASDVDCAGGSGNGPAYVSGPVHVKTFDIYGLDRDGDGVGCE
jgi:hypothetical protein